MSVGQVGGESYFFTRADGTLNKPRLAFAGALVSLAAGVSAVATVCLLAPHIIPVLPSTLSSHTFVIIASASGAVIPVILPAIGLQSSEAVLKEEAKRKPSAKKT